MNTIDLTAQVNRLKTELGELKSLVNKMFAIMHVCPQCNNTMMHKSIPIYTNGQCAYYCPVCSTKNYQINNKPDTGKTSDDDEPIGFNLFD